MSSNWDKANLVLRALHASGVRELCLCAGARNAPLIEAAHEWPKGFRIWQFNDERSAGFFALGRILASGCPVAVSTTSGTAAAELLPAVVEGHFAGLPLVVVTADRPPEYRFTGAPQVIEQVGLYQHYAETCVDVVDGCELAQAVWSRSAPLHLNVCFGEPLLERREFAPGLNADSLAPLRSPPSADVSADGVHEKQPWIEDFFSRVQKPLVLVSTLRAHEAKAVSAWLRDCPWPVYFEGTSRLREKFSCLPNALNSGGEVLSQLADLGLIDSVIRVGGIPTTRFWRDLESQYSDFPVLSLSGRAFAGLTRGQVIVCREPHHWQRGSEFFRHLHTNPDDMAKIAELRRHWQRRLESSLKKCPHSEPALLRSLIERIPEESAAYVGNSLPIREWDLIAPYDRPLPVLANRGANGIDGQISTFLGTCDPVKENWCFLGDLTTLYDLGAPWILRELPAATRLRLVVINNGGGRIFQRLFADAKFQNCHELAFADWAKMWGLAYQNWSRQEDLAGDLPERCVIELCPDFAESEAFWMSYGKLDSADT